MQSTCHPKGYYRSLIAVTKLYDSISYNNPVKRPPKDSYIGPWLVIQLYHISIIVCLCLPLYLSAGCLRPHEVGIDQRSSCMGIDSYKFFLLSLFSYNHYALNNNIGP